MKWRISYGIALVMLTSLLAACQTTEERVAQLKRSDDIECRKAVTSQQAYDACRTNLVLYRQIVASEDQANAERVAAGLQAAGASLQSINSPASPPPAVVFPQRVTCQRWPNGSVSCQ